MSRNNDESAFELSADEIQKELELGGTNRIAHFAANSELPNSPEWMQQLLADLAERRDRPALEIALDLIGRRTDIVAVQLPEPMCEGRPEIDAGCGATATHDGHDVILALAGGHRIWRSPEKATQLAAALLAVINAVRGGTK